MDAARAEQILQLADQLVADGLHTLRVDLSKVVFIDAAGLGCLVAIRNKTTAAGCALVIGHSSRTRHVSDLAGLE